MLPLFMAHFAMLLNPHQSLAIAGLMLKKLAKRLEEKDMTLTITPELKEKIGDTKDAVIIMMGAGTINEWSDKLVQ